MTNTAQKIRPTLYEMAVGATVQFGSLTLLAAGSTGNCKISDLFEKFVFRSRKTEFFAGSHI